MQGQLFTQDFLYRGICETPPYTELDEAGLAAFRAVLSGIYADLRADSALNEAQTEQLIIVKVLAALGWGEDYLPQVNATGKGREDVPDYLLFADERAKQAALSESRDERRYRHGIAIVEAKRWMRPLDRGDSSNATDPGAPSSQMLRYLSRADVVSDRAVKWGILTNGAVWRLYWQDARSRSEDFCEIDVALALGLPDVQTEFESPSPQHTLRLLYLLFRRAAFLPQEWDSASRTFHAYALNEARLYEEKVSADLGGRVFGEIFSQLSQALAAGDLQAQTRPVGVGRATRQQYTRAYLDEVREAALILLYRLLFLFYAEDRNLLPVRDERYAAYSVRRLREKVRDDVDQARVFSSRMDNFWRDLKGAFLLIDQGDDAIGMPAYNGGLFDRSRSPLLERTGVPDAVMAPILDSLSRRTENITRLWINYRDLSVSHLGSIYERLLEYMLEHEVQAGDNFDLEEINRVIARPASFARRVSGSYYTHHDLVRLLLRESVGQLADERLTAFTEKIAKLRKKAALNPPDWEDLEQRDPASAMLELTVCDPAMGSGHFLVALVDYLADRVLEAINLAEQAVNAQDWAAHLVEQNRPWQSPLVARIATIRRNIRQEANEHGWTVSDVQLDDRHIVRRMILKKCVFGVDKNPLAVELAKTALWLHTFTVGAPLSFLDHHLQCGDSLHGEQLKTVQDSLRSRGMLFQEGDLERLNIAAEGLTQVANLTDVDIAEVKLSKRLAQDARNNILPILRLLDFWRALRWLVPGWPTQGNKRRLPGEEQTPEQLAIAELLSGRHNLIAVLGAGQLGGDSRDVAAANDLLKRVQALAQEERFFHWWAAFPTVFGYQAKQGFDVVIGNPPWDRIKLQEVEWFAERSLSIAKQARAADRKTLIKALEKKRSPLWREYQMAVARAETHARVLGKSGDYPLLGGGDVNLYSLFVERAQALVRPQGLVALLTPSGIAADKGAAAFFRSIAAGSRLSALFDFENKKVFFPDIHASFKFSALVFGGEARTFDASRCAFYLHSLDDLEVPERVLTLSAEDFQRVNPNTAAAPVFRNRRDADITLRIYGQHPVLVDRSQGKEERVWPVKYVTMFHMTNDSRFFLTRTELEKQGFVPAPLNRWQKENAEALPLYEGKMVQMYDHRAADVVVNAENLHRAAQPETIQSALKEQGDRYPVPQYWVLGEATYIQEAPPPLATLAFKDVTAPTNARTMIAAFVPQAGLGNTLPGLLGETAQTALLLANLNSFAFDFLARQKVQGQHLNWYILEQLPVIAPERFEETLGTVKIADFIREQVLHLSYTAHDLAPLARDLGYDGPPFRWDESDRRERMAALDALFMHLYGLGADDAAYILDTFPIVREQDMARYGEYRTKTLILAGMDNLAKGQWP